MKTLSVIALLLIVSSVFFVVAHAYSQKLDVETVLISSNDVLLTVAHVSDLHYPNVGVVLSDVISAIKASQPDLIVMSGDIIDDVASKSDVTSLLSFFSTLRAVCPCYVVIGNHEIGSPILDFYVNSVNSSGAVLLSNQTDSVEINGKKIAITGISDGYSYNEKTNGFSLLDNADYKILIAHRPEKFPEYASSTNSPDVVFCGHAHGGFFRIGNLSLYAPNQGFFPKYTSGKYEKNNSTMLVSRGLGISGIDYRGFNKYHLIIAKIKPPNSR